MTGTIPPRPTHRDTAVLMAAAHRLEDTCKQWYSDDYGMPAEELLEIIRYNTDGYAIAKELEDLGVDPDAELVALLDNASTFLFRAHRDVVVEWVRECAITAPAEIGTPVRILNGSWKGKVGTIIEILHSTAQFKINLQAPKQEIFSGEIWSHLVLPYEAVEVLV